MLADGVPVVARYRENEARWPCFNDFENMMGEDANDSWCGTGGRHPNMAPLRSFPQAAIKHAVSSRQPPAAPFGRPVPAGGLVVGDAYVLAPRQHDRQHQAR